MGEALLKKLNKIYTPDTMIEDRFKNFDIRFKTDKAGHPVTLFIGTIKENGFIKGERFTRVLKFDESGNIIKDHWDNKGKVG